MEYLQPVLLEDLHISSRLCLISEGFNIYLHLNIFVLLCVNQDRVTVSL